MFHPSIPSLCLFIGDTGVTNTCAVGFPKQWLSSEMFVLPGTEYDLSNENMAAGFRQAVWVADGTGQVTSW